MDFEITPEEVKSKLQQGENMVLLDVREPWEYTTAHIEGSMHIPMGDLPLRAGHELGRDCHIVVVCHAGVRSAQVAEWLRQDGYKNVQSMCGGIDRWSRTIDPRVPLY